MYLYYLDIFVFVLIVNKKVLLLYFKVNVNVKNHGQYFKGTWVFGCFSSWVPNFRLMETTIFSEEGVFYFVKNHSKQRVGVSVILAQ